MYSQPSPLLLAKERLRSNLRQILITIAVVYALLLPTIHFGSEPSSGYITLLIIAAPLGVAAWLALRLLRFVLGR